MGLFFEMWFCRFCGQDFCNLCYLDLPPAGASLCRSSHSRDQFLPVSFLSTKELDAALHQMKLVKLDPSPHVPQNADNRLVKRYECGRLTTEDFAELWAKCEPFVLVGASDRATPEELLELDDSSKHPCTSTYYTGKEWVDDHTATLEGYFSTWNGQSKKQMQIRVSHPPPPPPC